MSKFIVLLKQVPDISKITDQAFDPETGNLVRSRLPAVINELDCQALAFAQQMRRLESDGNSKIIALTMGPESAVEVLQYALARCADEAVLLNDSKFVGSDTWATAKALACAVRKIKKEFISPDEPYYIISGMQSVDGDTAQVPAQLAADLDAALIPYAVDVTKTGGNDQGGSEFVFESIIEHGSDKVSPLSNPAVITVAKYHQLFPRFFKSRWANRKAITRWQAEDIAQCTGTELFGVKGSKTRVVRVFTPEKPKRDCREATKISEFADAILSEVTRNSEKKTFCELPSCFSESYVLPQKRLDNLDRSFEFDHCAAELFGRIKNILIENGYTKDHLKTPQAEITDQMRNAVKATLADEYSEALIDRYLDAYGNASPSYQGDVFVVAQCDDHKILDSTFELIAQARCVADQLDAGVGVVLIAEKSQDLEKELIASGADKVYTISDQRLNNFDPKLCSKAIAQAISQFWPQIVFYPATPSGRVLAPMVAYQLDCGLTADCTSFQIKDSSLRNEIGILYQTRPALGGNVMATIITKKSRSQMASARPGVFRPLEKDYSRKGTVKQLQVELSDSDRSLKIHSKEKVLAGNDLLEQVVITGGKGMQNRDAFDKLLNSLRESIDTATGIKSGVGASRAAVESGFASRSIQVGQTGTSISPKVYIAIGVSGAIQHMIGVSNAEKIFAINNDPNAPIFHNCDYYYVGKAEEVLPQLTKIFSKTSQPGWIEA